ncbi:unnamed protein product, partial [Prorocentrum cordatum]
MLKAAGSPDLTLAMDLARGFPLVGEMPRSGAVRPCTPGPRESPGRLLVGAPEKNERILRRIRAAGHSDANVAEALRDRARAEVEAGQACCRPPPPGLAGVVLSPRFGPDEGWRVVGGWRSRKARAIDNLTASGVNATAAAHESIAHDTLDRLVAAVQSLAAGGASVEHVRFRKDEASAHAWQRLGLAFQRFPLYLLRIVYPRFVDDFFGADADSALPGDGAVSSAPLARLVIQELLGRRLDPQKSVTAARSFVALGVSVS